MQIMNVATWAEFKSLVASKVMIPQYSESSTKYHLVAPESGILLWSYVLLKDGGSDVTDFENNYKSSWNKPLEIRPGVDKPIRVASSAQPLATTEHWKGFHATNDTDNEFTFDIAFSSNVWLRGGKVFSSDIKEGDRINASMVLVSSPTTVVHAEILNDVGMIPNVPIGFESAESLLMPTAVMLRVTVTKQGSEISTRTIHAICSYFQPDS